MSPQMTQFCSFLTLPFHSTQAVIGLEETHPPWEGQCALPSLSTQTLISSRNTPTDTPRIVFIQIIWALHGPAKLTLKVNHHKLEKQNLLSVWGSSLRVSAEKPYKELTELLTGESALNLS